jgi:hypothetical protein
MDALAQGQMVLLGGLDRLAMALLGRTALVHRRTATARADLPLHGMV